MVALVAALLGACAGLPVTGDSHLDKQLNSALGKFCPIAAKVAPDPAPTVDERMARAYFVLSAVTGYAVLSIGHYSGAADYKNDAALSLSRVVDAAKAIKETREKTKSAIYPIYHADMVIEFADAAEAALRPTVRAGKSLVTASVAGRIDTAKTAFLALIEDEIYRGAYAQSCQGLAEKDRADPAGAAARLAAAEEDLAARVRDRCAKLAGWANNDQSQPSPCEAIKVK